MPLTDNWNPNQYDLFKQERQQPFLDLLNMITTGKPIGRAVDLGCGTGELTQILHTKFRIGQTLGIDRSKAMLEKTALLQNSQLRWGEELIETWSDPEGVDLIFSNAALQWASNHENLIPHLLKSLNPGGQIAIQVPANHDHISHFLAAQIAEEAPFKEELGGYVRKSPVLLIEDYASLLHEEGMASITCFMKVYGHKLSHSRDVIEWVRGTMLTDYESRLPTEVYVNFLREYSTRLLAALGDREGYFYPFKRILFHAVKKP